jgi:hypothetical protein
MYHKWCILIIVRRVEYGKCTTNIKITKKCW